MIVSLRHLLGWMVSAFGSREDLVLENLTLRQQVLALHAKRPRRRLTPLHKLFWVALRTFWPGWTKPLVLVTPRTVVKWHRAGFRLYWAWVSRARQPGGRKRASKEVRALIFRMIAETGPRPRLRPLRRHRQGSHRLPGFLCPLERRRSRHRHSEASQGGVREAEVKTSSGDSSSFSFCL
jgi:hypothetical protein